MPTCPHCGGEYRQRQRGLCPGCHGEVEIWKDADGVSHWVAEQPKTKELLVLLENYIKTKPLMDKFSFGRWDSSSCMGNLHSTKVLLTRVDGDMELAREVIHAYYQDNRLYKPDTMHGVIGKQFQKALAIAKGRLEQRRKREAAEQARAERVNHDIQPRLLL